METSRIMGAAMVLAAMGASLAHAQNYPAVTLLQTDRTTVGEAFAYPAGHPQVTAAIVTLAPGETTVRHRHGVPFFVYVLEGEITVDYGEKGTRIYKTGDALMEAMAVEHAGTNTGAAPVRLLAVYMGADGARNVEVDAAKH